jgi:hypothetical protein
MTVCFQEQYLLHVTDACQVKAIHKQLHTHFTLAHGNLQPLSAHGHVDGAWHQGNAGNGQTVELKAAHITYEQY